uniref:ribonuclease H n=1 Tax=Salmo trutta TaxID=8032 RepID=A0A673XMB8_SALTR
MPTPLTSPHSSKATCHTLCNDVGPTSASDANPVNLAMSPPFVAKDNVSSTRNLTEHVVFLCGLGDSPADTYRPPLIGGVCLNGTRAEDTRLASWSEKSAISLEMFNEISKTANCHPLVPKTFRFPLGTTPQTTLTAIGVCALSIRIGTKELSHYLLVVADLPHTVYVGADILVRLGVKLDTIHQVLWSLAQPNQHALSFDPVRMASGQTIPEACKTITESAMLIPARTTEVSVRLNLAPGYRMEGTTAFFQPSPKLFDLGLTINGNPLLELTARSTYLLVQNLTQADISIPRHTQLGTLIDYAFHDFELVVPVIGPLPSSLDLDGEGGTLFTCQSKAIALTPVLPLDDTSAFRLDVDPDSNLLIYSIVTEDDIASPPACEVHSCEVTTDDSSKSDMPSPPDEDLYNVAEPYPGFHAQVIQLLSEADALVNDTERHQLRELFNKHSEIWSTDSLDCGVTSIHVVRIPTPPGATPTFVRQYKIPLAAYAAVQEIIDSLLAKRIIRECNSTYSAPVWPVLKPTGKWRLTIDYRQLNKLVPLSRWPMTQLDQELPKVANAKYFSTVDVANGFWTMTVDPRDQHKLAFSFSNKLFTFNRCPFGYANSPSEFNIFLHKAMPDAASRGTIIYVDDVLMRSETWSHHLNEMDHVLTQLGTAGAKLAIMKGQWCRTKVNYVGLLVGAEGILPQSNRIQAVRNIKTPTNLHEVRSFLGVCNYSRQFIENYADLSKPLTHLLQKDTPFVWDVTHNEAVDSLKNLLCEAPCLVYPNKDKTFFLEVGFSEHCLSAGLYQKYDQDKRVVAYASKTLNPAEHKYSDCEKALLSTVWAIKHFTSYVGGQKVIIETCHQPVTFLKSQRIREGAVHNSRIAAWLMTLQSHDVVINYAKAKNLPLGSALAVCQHCGEDETDSGPPPRDIAPPLPSNHHYFEENVCLDMPMAFVDGCS